MAQAAVNIPHAIDEKGSFDDTYDITSIGRYTVPSLDVDLSMKPDQSRKRRFSVSSDSNANDDSDYDDEHDDDSKASPNGGGAHAPNGAPARQHGGSDSQNRDPNAQGPGGDNGHGAGNGNPRRARRKHFIRKVYPKTKAATLRIYASVGDLFLWSGLDREQQKLLTDAMFEKKVAKGEAVITQGDRGDYFYVIESGVYQVWKSAKAGGRGVGGAGLKRVVAQQAPKLVFEYDNRGSFGELALMYNSPRAATVKAKTDGILWAVDRKTFRHIIVGSHARKRHRYDKFLRRLAIFDDISETTQSQIADVLEGFEYAQGEVVVEQGSYQCERFYLIQHGSANVVVRTKDGQTHIVSTLKDGDFFGERALLLNDVRSASVVVTSKSFVCCGMDKASFVRLLDGLDNKFRIKMASYTYQDDFERTYHNGDADLADIGSDQDDQ